ncbi:MAG: glycosyltransferase family 4 protein [Aigarchaeota archaeon]|nr:glycosyltransferase family 4 protein [Candidatus Calditenuaceae archaeon]
MRVALVNFTSGGVSGSGRHVGLLRKGLLELGVDVKVVDSKNVWFLDFPMLRAPTFTLGASLRTFDADVVHLHNPKLIGAALSSPSRSIITVHGGMIEFSLKYGALGRASARMMLALMRMVGRVTSVMKWEAERNGWAWVPNMTDLEMISKIEPANESVILFVGRHDPVKNYPLFKRVVERLGRNYKAFGVEEVASWEKVIAYMKSAECLMITSVWEGMPSVLLEAWASGCPVIAPRIPAFTPFHDAVILTDLRPEAYVDSYRRLDGLKDSIVSRGLELVRQFDYKSITRQYLEIYRELVTRS